MTWHQRTWLFLVRSAMEEGMHLSQQSTTGNGRPREGQPWKRRHIFPGLFCPGEARCEKKRLQLLCPAMEEVLAVSLAWLPRALHPCEGYMWNGSTESWGWLPRNSLAQQILGAGEVGTASTAWLPRTSWAVWRLAIE